MFLLTYYPCSLNNFYMVSGDSYAGRLYGLTPSDLPQEQSHPFVQAMGDFLLESGLRANRPPIMNTLMRGSSAKFEADMATMNHLVDERRSSFVYYGG